jgi:hypothetical protein
MRAFAFPGPLLPIPLPKTDHLVCVQIVWGQKEVRFSIIAFDV